MEQLVIEIKNISKIFKVGYKKKGGLSHVISLFSGIEKKKEFHAIRDMSFDVYRGDKIGIIGTNGSGKTTLLRTLANVYRQNGGEIKIKGDVILLSNLPSILQNRMNIMDNIYYVGTLLGLKRTDIIQIVDAIIDFADLKEFVYTKVYQLSKGMCQRLAFSIAMYCVETLKPAILLLDEVFTKETDEYFRLKCLGKVDKIIGNGMTVIIASHNMEIMNRYCTEVILIDKGKLINKGDVKTINAQYKNMLGN